MTRYRGIRRSIGMATRALAHDRPAEGSVTALHLPDYDPAISDVIWFRDYAAYCGLTASGKQLYAVGRQVTVRKPVVAKKLSAWNPGESTASLCSRPVAA